jgi:aminoglycoside phosphotransferase (APT) family kinase protein
MTTDINDAEFTDPELIQTRADEYLPLERLEPYLRNGLPACSGPMRVRQFGGGHANLTYLVAFDDAEYVLRRPPLGPVAPGSHDMGREFRVLSRLANAFDLAPRSYLHCEDDAVIGAPFQIMERRHGFAIRRELPPAIAADAPLQRRIGEMMVDALADLHLVDREAAGLGDLGRPDGFVARQLEGWTRRWHAAKDQDLETMDRVCAWLGKEIPATGPVGLVHNDYKLDNMLVAEDDPARCVAILDWDMCTSGDPLTDLGYLLNQWVEADDPAQWIAVGSMPTHAGGFATRDEVIERYAARTGFDCSNVRWYYAFSIMKLVVIIQQIYIRYLRGQTRDERFANYGERVRVYAAKACVAAGI